MIPAIKAYPTQDLHLPEKGWRCEVAFYENPIERDRTWRRGWDGRGSFLKGYIFPLRIECSAITLLAALMRKWPLNSSFTASNPFYHLQQHYDVTSILRKALRHTSAGLALPGVDLYQPYIRTPPQNWPRRVLFSITTWFFFLCLGSSTIVPNLTQNYIRTIFPPSM